EGGVLVAPFARAAFFGLAGGAVSAVVAGCVRRAVGARRTGGRCGSALAGLRNLSVAIAGAILRHPGRCGKHFAYCGGGAPMLSSRHAAIRPYKTKSRRRANAAPWG